MAKKYYKDEKMRVIDRLYFDNLVLQKRAGQSLASLKVFLEEKDIIISISTLSRLLKIHAKADKQAQKMMEEIVKSTGRTSFGTDRTHAQRLTVFANHLKDGQIAHLKNATAEQANRYLQSRAATMSHETVKADRLAIERMLHATGRMEKGQRLNDIRGVKTTPQARAYTREETAKIMSHQTAPYALSTAIALNAGLRASELYTLNRSEVQPPDLRPESENKFKGIDNSKYCFDYTVKGKGGLIRTIVVSREHARQVEKLKLDKPRVVIDRGIRYSQSYSIKGGNAWAKSFSDASLRALNKSTGAHGLRHGYAQERVKTIQSSGQLRSEALLAVSQEMGHHRDDKTEVYLR